MTIDPHKLGYVPYPAGAFLLRDRRAHELVATDPPYPADKPWARVGRGPVLSRFVFDGSKPGAAATAVWLSDKVLPLDERDHCCLIERTVCGARRLHEPLACVDCSPFRVVRLPEPDINIVCYILHYASLDSLEALNAFNERIYERMSVSRAGARPEYIITRTRFQSPMYDGAVDPLLAELGVCTPEEWRAVRGAGLVVLRSTVMDPFLGAPEAPDHIDGLIAAFRRGAEECFEELDLRHRSFGSG